MTLEVLINQINEACAKAGEHAAHCGQLIENQGLAAVLAYCQDLSVEPPQFSLTSKSVNGENLRAAAKRKLSDRKWWEKTLELAAIRTYEGEQIAQGKVTQFVSDGLAAYKGHGSRGRAGNA
jgi:hypothetical protein